ncbi:hypothetical protein GGQ54_003086 [Naumannella cuiyingiana]|uniref:Uncharacterized protein n=1 Tax=Naumannella cuiyingiana TaxID=1347891 RepID=A0A7Z0DBY4_9ACTN|nr:hypothetical protein [Naumannella cuiyingiana]NYI72526.1 hypothetical protein [Naumannella cuiyingiana]
MARPTGLVRRVTGALATVALLGAAVLVAVQVRQSPTAAPPPAPGAPQSPGPTDSPGPIDSPDPTAPTAPAPQPTADAPAPPAATTGPGLDRVGVTMIATPDSEGGFRVVEYVRLPRPAASLELRPPRLDGAGSALASAEPVAAQVQVTAADQPVEVPQGRVAAPVSLGLPAPADTAQLAYRISGVGTASLPSKAGRWLAALGPLAAAGEATPVMIVVTGPTVLGINCPLLDPPARSCQSGSAPRLATVRALPRPQALVLVQYDAPMPR